MTCRPVSEWKGQVNSKQCFKALCIEISVSALSANVAAIIKISRDIGSFLCEIGETRNTWF